MPGVGKATVSQADRHDDERHSSAQSVRRVVHAFGTDCRGMNFAATNIGRKPGLFWNPFDPSRLVLN